MAATSTSKAPQVTAEESGSEEAPGKKKKPRRTRVSEFVTFCAGCTKLGGHVMFKVADPDDEHHILRCNGCDRERRVERKKGVVSLDDIASEFAKRK